jgi:hypothetical protein
MNTKKRNILIVSAVIVLFAVTYFIYLNKLSTAKNDLQNREIFEEKRFNEIKEKLKTEFTRENENESYLFDELFNFENAISFKDTSISFFVYSTHLEVKLIDFNYLKSIQLKAKSEAINKRSDDEYNKQISVLVNKHGDYANSWASKIGKDMFLDLLEKNDCKPYFANNNSYTIDPVAFSELNRFLVEYKMYEQKMNLQNEITIRNYQSKIQSLKRSLNQDAIDVLERNLGSNEALQSKDESFSFNWAGYGNFDYSITRKEIDNEYIDNTMNEVYAEQYKDYSLRTGAMPYGYCFGTSNSGQSGVKVNAGGSDVLVTIKNMNDEVIRHAYIEARRSYRLNLPNGNYNVYFYYGTGWNPKRFMKDTDCGRLVGGFLSNETVTKDPSVLRLYSQIMVYTLTEQINGNFSTSGSSKGEAF